MSDNQNLKVDQMTRSPDHIYLLLRESIPEIKEEISVFLNKKFNLNKNPDFWWAIYGEMALASYYLDAIFGCRSAFVKLFIRSYNGDNLIIKQISNNLVKFHSIHSLLKAPSPSNFFLNTLNRDVGVATRTESSKFAVVADSQVENLNMPLEKLCGSLYLAHRYVNKIKNIFLRHINCGENKNEFKNDRCATGYMKIFNDIFNKSELGQLPRWFIKFCSLIVHKNRKWTTYFGYERNMYMVCAMAESIGKFGPCNVKLISHGAVTGALSFWHLYRFSLFPDLRLEIPKFNNSKNNLIASNKTKQRVKKILFCPPQLPFFADFVCVEKFSEFFNYYSRVIDILLDKLNSGVVVNIKYKDFDYLSDYQVVLTQAESAFFLVDGAVEDLVRDVDLVVSLPFGSVADYCDRNNIDQLVFNFSYQLTNIKAFEATNLRKGVFCDFNAFELKLIES